MRVSRAKITAVYRPCGRFSTGNKPFNLDQKICRLQMLPSGFFFSMKQPTKLRKIWKFWLPKQTQKMGSFGKWVFHASFWVSRNGTRALHDTNHAKARRCSYRVNLDTKKPPSWALLEKDDYGHYGCSQLMWHPQKQLNLWTTVTRNSEVRARSLTPGCSWNDPTWSNHTFVPPSCSIDRVSPNFNCSILISFQDIFPKKELIPSVSSRLLCTCAYTCVVE